MTGRSARSFSIAVGCSTSGRIPLGPKSGKQPLRNYNSTCSEAGLSLPPVLQTGTSHAAMPYSTKASHVSSRLAIGDTGMSRHVSGICRVYCCKRTSIRSLQEAASVLRAVVESGIMREASTDHCRHGTSQQRLPTWQFRTSAEQSFWEREARRATATGLGTMTHLNPRP